MEDQQTSDLVPVCLIADKLHDIMSAKVPLLHTKWHGRLLGAKFFFDRKLAQYCHCRAGNYQCF